MKLRIRQVTHKGGTIEYVVQQYKGITFWGKTEWISLEAFVNLRAAEQKCEELILNRNRQLATKIKTLKTYKSK